MKKFTERSNRGKRNLLILYSIIILIVLSIVISQMNVPISKTASLPNLSESKVFENTQDERKVLTIEEERIDNINGSTKISESDFIANAIYHLGHFYSKESNKEIGDGIGNVELIEYVYSPVIPTYVFNHDDFNEITVGQLSVGDLGYSNGIYGIYLGYIEGNHTFLTSSPLGACYEIEQGMVTLNYLADDSNELLYGMYPINFEHFYHNAKLDFSKGNAIDTKIINTLYTEETKYSKIEDFNYMLSILISDNNHSELLKYLNTSYLKNKSYALNENQISNYFDSLLTSSDVVDKPERCYFKIDSYVKMDDSFTCDITIYSIKDDFLLKKIKTTTFSIFTDMTFLPCSVLDIDANGYKYGFIPINENETMIQETNTINGVSEYDNNIILDEEGKYIIRQNGFDFDMSQILNNNTPGEQIHKD